MKKCKTKHGHGFFTIACMLILLVIPGVLCAATYYSDTNGDGLTDTITTSEYVISVAHGGGLGTSTYNLTPNCTLYNPNTTMGCYKSWNIVSVSDADGQIGNEIIGKWKTYDHPFPYSSPRLTDQGIFVIHDRIGPNIQGNIDYYYYTPPSPIFNDDNLFGYDESFTITGIANTDGQPGNEITVNWSICNHPTMYTNCQPVSQGTDVIHDPKPSPFISTFPGSKTSSRNVAVKFATVYKDPNGAKDITDAYIGWRSDLSSLANAIILYYDALANNLYLYNDAGTGLIGPCKPGKSNTLSNSQGKLNCGQTTVQYQNLNSDLKITWSVTPTAYVGQKNMYFRAVDTTDLDSGIIQKGTWTIN
jgi:hypothetical protein